MTPIFGKPGKPVSELDRSLLVAAPEHLRMIDSMLDSRIPHESDFRAFALFRNPDCVFFDIGANIGNSALSVHFVQPRWTVVSFEPNVALNPLHDRVRAEFEADGVSFHVFNVGLGAEPGNAEFYMPRIGAWNVVGEASFDLEHFRDPHVIERLSSYSSSGEWELVRTSFPIVRFDEFEGIKPIIDAIKPNQGVFVKIDIEGFEENALRGMSEFVRQRRPYLMIENTPSDSVPDLLSEMGYSAYYYEIKIDRLAAISDRKSALNLFYVHDSFRDSGQIADVFAS